MAAAGAEGLKPVRVWDWPVRLIHWTLVLLIAFSWWSAENDHLGWHRLSGYTIIGLLTFRLYWGLAGSQTARFGAFVKGPGEVLTYARGLFGRRPADGVGHNALGGWSVLAMLTLLVAQVSLGLFAVDTDGLESGPFSAYVDFHTGRVAAHWHHVVFNLLLALIALHVAAIAFYAVVKRDNLVGPMLTGFRTLPASTPPVRFAPFWKLALGIVIAAGVAVVLSRGGRLL